MARCTRIGRAERDVSGSRSLRSTRYEMPWRARVSARPAEGRPAANKRCTESSARMVCGGVRGMESRTPHGLLPSTCSGSSWLVPQTWVANGAPGTTSTRPGVGVPVLCALSQSAASCQYRGIAVKVPGGVSRAVQASEVLTAIAVSTTIPTATRLSRSGCATARSHCDLGTLPGSGIRPSNPAMPKTSGSRITGPTLCTLRSGVPPASKNACT
ncbi:hypothetical protein LAUMK15_00554 [Mycobacterium persicum]|nr:hypothetical protein LAUMK15_00554 [Mycobacterium persicum]